MDIDINIHMNIYRYRFIERHIFEFTHIYIYMCIYKYHVYPYRKPCQPGLSCRKPRRTPAACCLSQVQTPHPNPAPYPHSGPRRDLVNGLPGILWILNRSECHPLLGPYVRPSNGRPSAGILRNTGMAGAKPYCLFRLTSFSRFSDLFCPSNLVRPCCFPLPRRICTTHAHPVCRLRNGQQPRLRQSGKPVRS